MAGGAVDAVVHEVLYVLTIAGVLIVQSLTHKAEHKSHGNHIAHETLSMFFRELTVLGIVAFCLYTLESSGALQLDINDKHTFEKVHNSLFHVALLYGCLVGAVYYASVRLSRSWATLEDRVERADWKQLKRRWQELSDEVGMDDNSDPPSWVAWSRSKTVREWYDHLLQVTFHDLRFYTMKKFPGVPATFRLSIYLDMVKERLFGELVEISESSWVVYAVCLSVDIAVRGLLTSYAGVADPTVHSMVVFIIIIIVSYRVWVVVARALAVVRFNEKLGISAEEVEACVEDGFCARLPAEMVKGTEAHEVKKLDLSSTAAATGPLTRTPARERTRRRASSVLAEAETIVKKQLSGDKEAHSDVGAAEAATPAPKKIENMAVFVASLFPFNNPDWALRALQTCLFGFCLNLALVFSYWGEVSHNSLFPVLVILCLVTVAVLLRIVSSTVGMYTACLYAGDLTDTHILGKAAVASAKRAQGKAKRSNSPKSSIHVSTSGRLLLVARPETSQCYGNATAGVKFALWKSQYVTLAVLTVFFNIALSTHTRFETDVGTALWTIEAILMSVFIIELVAEVVIWGPANYFKMSLWNSLDVALVVVASIATFSGSEIFEEGRTAATIARGLILLRLPRNFLVLPALYERDARHVDAESDAVKSEIDRQDSTDNALFSPGGGGGGASVVDTSALTAVKQPGHHADGAVFITEGTFDANVMRSEHAWMLKVYDPACTKCLAFIPTWQELVSTMSSGGEAVKFGEIDGTVNARLCDRLEILGYPSLLLFPAGPKMEGNCHTFHGERTLANITGFIGRSANTDFARMDMVEPDEWVAARLGKLKGREFAPDDLDLAIVSAADRDDWLNIVKAREVFHNKRVVVFGLPGAFTAFCSSLHLPNYISHMRKIRDHGVDDVLCMAVNDPYVLRAWGQQQRVGNHLHFLSDDGTLTKFLGLEVPLPGVHGFRCARFAAVVDHGVVTFMAIDSPMGSQGADAMDNSNAFALLRGLRSLGSSGH